MIEIKVPKEITEYKEKLVFGLTARQAITTSLALIINIPLYFFGKEILGTEIMSWVVILTTIPFAAIGFFKCNGMYFEKFLIVLLQSYIYPPKRKYEMRNYLAIFNEEEEAKNDSI